MEIMRRAGKYVFDWAFAEHPFVLPVSGALLSFGCIIAIVFNMI